MGRRTESRGPNRDESIDAPSCFCPLGCLFSGLSEARESIVLSVLIPCQPMGRCRATSRRGVMSPSPVGGTPLLPIPSTCPRSYPYLWRSVYTDLYICG